jgi:hypothetical protein
LFYSLAENEQNLSRFLLSSIKRYHERKRHIYPPLKTGENALILLAENKSEQEKLYHHLVVDAYRFKK